MKFLTQIIRFISNFKNSLISYNVPIFLFPTNCKYHPSCSQYATEALYKHGFWRGSLMSVWRIIRCNFGSRGGVDFA